MGVDNSGAASGGEFGTPNAASETASESGSGSPSAASDGKLAASGAPSGGKLAASGALSFLDSTDGKGKRKPVMQTSAACVLATIGFACLTVWGTYIVFSPALPLLSFEPLEIAILCLIVSRVVMDACLAFCSKFPDFVFRRMRPLVLPGSLLLFAPAFILAGASWAGLVPEGWRMPCAIAVWVLLGAGELSLSLVWTVLFSMMAPKWTAMSIAVGGALATPLFLLVAGAGSPLMGLFGLAFIVISCMVLASILVSRVDPDTLKAMEGYQRDPSITLKAAASIAANGMAYGFVVVMLALSGIKAVLIASAAGIVGSGVAIFWATKRTKSRWDMGGMQRLTVPIVAASILFIPYFGHTGRIVCGAVAVGAFAYATLMEWTDLVVSNAEFQLYPVKRYAMGRLAQWTGFALGVVVAFFAFRAGDVAIEELGELSCVIAIIVVAAFSLYGADDSETEDALLSLMTASAECPPSIDPPKNASPFRDRCRAIAEQYDLSPREAEVFTCLAKGRNAEYIQQKLFISSNTAKTHITHIYRKMGINSQQRLIDLVDREEQPPAREERDTRDA